MLSTAQSSPTVVASLGYQALGDLAVSPKATPLDQPRYHRPATQGQKRQLKKRLYGRTKPGTLLKHHIWVETRAVMAKAKQECLTR
jgi:hypothetical protein